LGPVLVEKRNDVRCYHLLRGRSEADSERRGRWERKTSYTGQGGKRGVERRFRNKTGEEKVGTDR